jgi:hypothetical protein
MFAIRADISALRWAMNSSSDGSVLGAVLECGWVVEKDAGAACDLEVSPSGLPGPEAEGVGWEWIFASATADAAGAVEEVENWSRTSIEGQIVLANDGVVREFRVRHAI